MNKLPSVGISAIDDVHNFIWDLRMKGKPCSSIKLRPGHYQMYIFWAAKTCGPDKIYGPDGKQAAPIECDGVQILEGTQEQWAQILPNFLPSTDAGADKWRDFNDKFGKAPEHHSQLN